MAHGDCTAGTICLVDTCAVPECSADNTTAPCAHPGEECAPYSVAGAEVDFGDCFTPCTPFVDTACVLGEFCVPTGEDADGKLVGQCVPAGSGTATLGLSCSTELCQDGLVCLDLGDGNPTCNATCWAGAGAGQPGACTGGEVCAPLLSNATTPPQVLVYGFCQNGCTPFQTPDPCADGEWCEPNLLDPAVGECTADTGTAAVGDACGESAAPCCTPTPGLAGCAADPTLEACVCGADPFCCAGEWDSVCVTAVVDACAGSCAVSPGATCAAGGLCVGSTCGQICDPGAAPPNPGSCGAGAACVALYSGDIKLAAGVCQEVCDYHAGVDCGSAADVCWPGELFGLSFDPCIAWPATWWPDAEGLPAGASCPAEFAQDGTMCQPNGVCIDLLADGNLLCYEVCFVTEGALESDPHPDCTAPGPTQCSPLYGPNSAFGLCF
jgi:hypothetical protein